MSQSAGALVDLLASFALLALGPELGRVSSDGILSDAGAKAGMAYTGTMSVACCVLQVFLRVFVGAHRAVPTMFRLVSAQFWVVSTISGLGLTGLQLVLTEAGRIQPVGVVFGYGCMGLGQLRDGFGQGGAPVDVIPMVWGNVSPTLALGIISVVLIAFDARVAAAHRRRR